MKSSTQAFTLLEMLVVLVVIGILMAIIFVNMSGQLQRSKVQNAAAQVGTDLEQARSAAWKTGQATTIKVLSPTQYSYASAASTKTVSLPDGTQFSYTGTPPSISYFPPFADTSATSRVITLTTTNSAYPNTLRIIGVTGKVIR